MRTISIIITSLATLFTLILWLKNSDMLFLSARNLIKGKRRSILTLLAIIFAGVTMVLIGGYNNGTIIALQESFVKNGLGHVQIQIPEYYEKGRGTPTQYLIKNVDDIIEAIESDSELSELVLGISTEMRFNGLIMGNLEDSSNFLGQGKDPEKEYIFTPGTKFGEYINSREGAKLSDDLPNGVILGKGLAKSIGVTVDDIVTLLSSSENSGMNTRDAIVVGIESPLAKDYSDVMLKSTKTFAQDLLYTEGANAIIVMLHETKDTVRAAERIESIMQSKGWDMQVLQWTDLADFYVSVANWFRTFMIFVRVMLGSVTIFFVLNTINMSITERYGEIGTMRSIGNTKNEIMQLFISEGVLLSVLGIILSISLGMALAYLLSNAGIMMPPPPGQDHVVPLLLVYSEPEHFFFLADIAMILFLASFIASYLPSRKAVKLKIVDCLRHL